VVPVLTESRLLDSNKIEIVGTGRAGRRAARRSLGDSQRAKFGGAEEQMRAFGVGRKNR